MAKKEPASTPPAAEGHVIGKHHRDALQAWVNGTPDGRVRHKEINEALNGDVLKNSKHTARALRLAGHINHAISKSPTSGDQTVYRGASNIGDLKPGQRLVSPRLQSATKDPRVAREHAFNYLKPNHKGTIFEIHVPHGTPMIDVNRHVRHSLDESEHLFGSHQAFEVKHVGDYDRDGYRKVKVHAIETAQKMGKAQSSFGSYQDAFQKLHDMQAQANNAVGEDQRYAWSQYQRLFEVNHRAMEALQQAQVLRRLGQVR